METNQKRKSSIVNCKLSILLLLAAVFSGFATDKDAPDKMITILVHATDCDSPAKGAQIVIIDAGWEDNLASGTTNNAGECSMKVRAGYNIVVQATYKGEVKKTSYFATDEDYGKQIVFVKYNVNCKNDDEIPEKIAIKYNFQHDETDPEGYGGIFECISYDNYGKRWRRDVCYGYKEQVFHVDIYDHISHKSYQYFDENGNGNAGKPDEWGKGPVSEDEENQIWYGGSPNEGGPFIYTDEHLKDRGFTQRADTVILGKTCSVWVEPKTVFGRPTNNEVIYKWKRILIRNEKNGKVTFQLAKITDNVPEEAFTGFIIAPYWIK